MSFYRVHLSRSSDGVFTGVLCGAKLFNPQKVTLPQECQSPSDLPMICPKCDEVRKTDQHKYRHWEFGLVNGQETVAEAQTLMYGTE